ncbi:hypothetical protein CPB84DRAFT_1772873 [Gymnopilus junonius]|uniref:Uncharacterized protein n=1 Tax=Gymnopilus junonius TaxID=109634 RepID=A0A9P5NPQ6_GYMJU|nr:hypothetical protein CPB84DRAFT_1772873 [Gymnopilus junonius]
MVHPVFRKALVRRYEAVKAQYPMEGRRKWRLRVLYESWPLLASDNCTTETGLSGELFETDPDPLDPVLEDGELGLIIRTDFSHDEAWDAFCQKVQTAQKELISDLTNGDAEAAREATSPEDVRMQDVTESPANAHDDDSDSSGESPDIIKFIIPSNEVERSRLRDISNIKALRLFSDVDVRQAPSPGPDRKRISPQNPLIDQGGWQEIYTGKNLWIYDANSNKDECVRVVSQEGDFYGTATGDSWRARASHICELQFNMSYSGMKIDFNGQDKWDWNERVRDIKEASTL